MGSAYSEYAVIIILEKRPRHEIDSSRAIEVVEQNRMTETVKVLQSGGIPLVKLRICFHVGLESSLYGYLPLLRIRAPYDSNWFYRDPIGHFSPKKGAESEDPSIFPKRFHNVSAFQFDDVRSVPENGMVGCGDYLATPFPDPIQSVSYPDDPRQIMPRFGFVEEWS